MAEIDLLIVGRNQSSQALNDANRDVQRFATDVERGSRRTQQNLQGVSSEMVQVSRVTRLFVSDVATQLNPVLGDTVNALGQAASASRGFGLATGAAVGALAVVGVGLANYIQTLTAAAERQAALNLAIRNLDAGAIRSQITQLSAEVERNAIKWEELKRGTTNTPLLQGRFSEALATARKELSALAEGGLTGFLRRVAEGTGYISRATEELAKARSGLAQVLPAENELMRAEAYAKQQAALQPLLATEAQRASIEKDVEGFVAAHQRMAAALASEAAAAREAALAQGRIAEAQAEPLGAAQLEQVRERTRATIELIETQHVARQRALELARDQGVLDIRQRRLPPIQGDLQPAEGVAPTSAELRQLEEISVRTIQRRLDGELAINQAEQDRLGIMTQVSGLGVAERESLDALVGAEQDRLRILQSQLEVQRLQADPTTSPGALQAARLRQSNAEFQAAQNAAERQRSVLERTDFDTGVRRGFRDVLDEFQSEGRAGEGLVRDIASGMHQTFQDLFFLPLQKDWQKSLIDIPRQLLSTGLKPLIDFASRQLTGSLVEGFSKAFPALGLSGSLMLGTGALPGTAAAEQLLAAGAGQRQAALSVVTGGQSAIIPSSALDMRNLLVARPGPAGTTVVDTPLGGLDVRPPELIPGAAAGGLFGSGIGFGQLAGGVAGAAGLATLAARGLSTGPQEGGLDRLLGIGSGAISGAVLGTSIYPGIGTFIGAVAGAVLGAATTGKGDDPEVARQRTTDRARQAQAITTQMLNAITGAGSIERALATPIQQVAPERPTTFTPELEFIRPGVLAPRRPGFEWPRVNDTGGQTGGGAAAGGEGPF